jgi:NACHT domain
MSQPILDKAAHLFSVGFYQGLGSGKSIEQAYEMGCIAIQIWSETNSQFTQSRKYRKFTPEVEIAQPDSSSQLPEYQKPVLLRKFPDSTTATGKTDRSPEFIEFVKQEIDRQEYKDFAREAYDNFGQFSAQNATSVTKSEYAQRKILLGKVKQFWIEGFLNPSLQGAAALSLSVTARPDAISDLTQGIEALLVELDPSYERLKESPIYAEMGQGWTLLILGSPGAGKTIALLQLAQRLIDRSEQDLSLPIPVVFNLSAWARDRKSIFDWAIDELREKYQVPKSLSEPWIRQQQLIFLLDGLDEVDENHRNDCVRKLNDFIGLFPQTEIAVCSRVRDYDALTERLQISSALCLQPLTSEQIYRVLDSVGGTLKGLKTLLKNDAKLEEFARTPLILNFMSVAYTGWSVEDLIPQLKVNPADRDRHLFDTYIDKRLAQGAASAYARDRILHWLSWLARGMFQKKRTIFLIEKMQPNWLQHQHEERAYQIIVFIVAGLIAGLNGTIVGMVTDWLIPNLNFGNMKIANAPLIFGLTAGIIGGLVTALPTKIVPLEQLSWSWQRARSSSRCVSELLAGVIFGLILGMILWLSSGEVLGLSFGLISGLIFGLFFVLGSGLGSSEINKRTTPNQGIRSSVKNSWIVGLIGGLVFGVMFGLTAPLFGQNESIIKIGLIGGMIFGLLFGLKYGGAAWTQHLVLRWILHQKGHIPWNYAKFLDFASERLLMKKIGGGYVFFHRMLLEHFTGMKQN